MQLFLLIWIRKATISCVMKDEKGVVLALGEHGKVAIDISTQQNLGFGKGIIGLLNTQLYIN